MTSATDRNNYKHTAINQLGSAYALSHNVLGTVVLTNEQATIIEARGGARLHRFSYVMGGPDGVVEVSCIGPTAVTLSK